MSQMLSMAVNSKIVAVFMIAAACKLLEMKLCCLEAGLPVVDRSEGSDLEMMTKLMKASHRASSPRLLTRMMRWRLEEV